MNLQPSLLVREHVDAFEDHHFGVGVHALAVRDGFEFILLIIARAAQLMTRPQLAQISKEANHSFAVEGVDGTFVRFLLLGQDVRGFDEAFDRDGLGFEAALRYCGGDGGGDERFAAAGTAGECDESAAVRFLLGVVLLDVLCEAGGEGFGFHFGWLGGRSVVFV